MSINVERAGDEDAPAIIFVHGSGGSAATWFMQLKGLSNDFHVIALELNGHGKSPDSSNENTIESYLSDIDEIVTQYEKPVLAGHSMGGALSQLYALRHPEKIGGIILIGTGAKLRVAPLIFDMLRNNFEGYVDAAGSYMFSEETSTELIEASKIEIRKCKPSIINRDFAACNDFDIMEMISNISLPALILVGDQDLMTPVKYSSYLHERLPNSTLHVIENAGHSVMLEQPGQFNAHISEWMSALQ
ncbi:MAG: alpha/beta hydrolase [Candidatus Thorarchaeota archaeon]|nr:alpha/beta hydrolase [Candidatus Thorarchaeota archaeon]